MFKISIFSSCLNTCLNCGCSNPSCLMLKSMSFGICTSYQGCRKQSPDGQAQLDVGGEAVNNSRTKRAAKIWTLVFLAVRRRSHCTSASNWDSKAWKFSHTERKSYACALRYVPAKFYYSNSRPHKCRTRNYVSTSAEHR